MKAILTSYLPCTNFRPSRIKASAEGVKSIAYTCDELENSGAHNAESRHELAARKFADAKGWNRELISGGLPNGDFAHCFIRLSPSECSIR